MISGDTVEDCVFGDISIIIPPQLVLSMLPALTDQQYPVVLHELVAE
jgi:hypothetical protein